MRLMPRIVRPSRRFGRIGLQQSRSIQAGRQKLVQRHIAPARPAQLGEGQPYRDGRSPGRKTAASLKRIDPLENAQGSILGYVLDERVAGGGVSCQPSAKRDQQESTKFLDSQFPLWTAVFKSGEPFGRTQDLDGSTHGIRVSGKNAESAGNPPRLGSHPGVENKNAFFSVFPVVGLEPICIQVVVDIALNSVYENVRN